MIAAALVACKKKDAATGTGSGSGSDKGSGSGSGSAMATGPGSGSAVATGSGSAADSGSGSGSGSAAAATPQRRAIPVTGFSTPESVLYDAANDRYLVSNINGGPADVDGNGFISSVTVDGKIDPTKIKVGFSTFSSTRRRASRSRGRRALRRRHLVRRCSTLKTGAAKGEVKIDGATFLNDVTPAKGGSVFVSDTGVDAKFQPTGADAIWKIGKDGKATALIKDKDLGGPNGLVQVGDLVWCVTLRSGEMFSVDAKGKKDGVQKFPKGSLDGIVAMDDGSFLVSSWEAAAVYAGKGADWKIVEDNVKAPADIGWDSKRKRLLVPMFQENQIVLVGM